VPRSAARSVARLETRASGRRWAAPPVSSDGSCRSTQVRSWPRRAFIGGLLGSALGGLGGGAIGGLLGNRNLGNTIGSTAGGILGGILPFEAGPQFAPFANAPMAAMYPGIYGGMYYR
jgi:hypothetical protein